MSRQGEPTKFQTFIKPKRSPTVVTKKGKRIRRRPRKPRKLPERW